MIIAKTCSTCEHFPNDDHCIGCLWDVGKRENTKWELKKNPLAIELSVLDNIRAEIEARLCDVVSDYTDGYRTAIQGALAIIDKYKAESEYKE